MVLLWTARCSFLLQHRNNTRPPSVRRFASQDSGDNIEYRLLSVTCCSQVPTWLMEGRVSSLKLSCLPTQLATPIDRCFNGNLSKPHCCVLCPRTATLPMQDRAWRQSDVSCRLGVGFILFHSPLTFAEILIWKFVSFKLRDLGWSTSWSFSCEVYFCDSSASSLQHRLRAWYVTSSWRHQLLSLASFANPPPFCLFFCQLT